MIACDTSVLVAAFARWHESHMAAATAVRRCDALIDHAVIETFSVLTRLPAPRRAPRAAQLIDGTRSPSGAGPGGVPSPKGRPPSRSRPCGVRKPDRSGPSGTTPLGLIVSCTP